jgi:peroxiredoxin
MPALESAMIALGTPMPAFELPDTRNGATIRSGDFAGRPVLVMFICNHCPFVVHVRAQLAALGREHAPGPLAVVAISSNDPASHPADAPDRMKAEAASAGYVFPYCFDASQRVARDFGAVCTPDFFLFDAAHRLAYRGRLDASRPGNGEPVTGSDLRQAIAEVLRGQAPAGVQHPSLGCSIKWKASATG